MNEDVIFSYNYSAKENEEVQTIRSRYLPKSESKLEEARRLDSMVRTSGVTQSLCAGIGGLLVFGTGMCCSLGALGEGAVLFAAGILLGILGTAAMLSAYPIYRAVFNKTKAKYAPRILELTAELSGINKT